MKYHDQTILNDPESGAVGDCFRVCVANLLNLDPSEVPHFAESGDLWEHNCREWAAERGLLYWWHQMKRPGQAGSCMGWTNPFVWIAGGPGPRGVGHSVLMRGTKMIHDPHSSRAGLLEIEDATFFVPFDLSTWNAHPRRKEDPE